MSFDALFAAADRAAARVPVIAAGGADRTVLEALSTAAARGWVSPMLTGDASDIRTLADEHRIDLSPFCIVPGDDPAATAVAEIRAGRARLLMKGQIATPALMKAVLARDTGLRTDRVIAQVVLMEIPRDDRRFLLADTGITIQPTFEQKLDLVRRLAEVARSLELTGDGSVPSPPSAGERDRVRGPDASITPPHPDPLPPSECGERGQLPALPRIAVMAATEKATEAMPDTLEAAELQRRCEAGEIPGCVVQGPLSFDLAYAAEAGDRKRIAGDVVGSADALLFPNLPAANLTVKAIMYTADCRFGGLLVGTSAPVVFMSRADSTATRLNSLAFTLQWLAHQRAA